MFVNKTLEWFQNSRLGNFLSDSLIFENIDNISFALLILTIVSTSFMSTGKIGAFACLFALSCFYKVLVKKGESAELSFLNKILILYLLFVIISLMGASYFILSLKGIIKTFIYISFYFGAVYFFSSNKNKIFPAVLTIALVTSAESVIGIMQNLSHIDAIATWQDTSNIDPSKIISRAYGTLQPYNPNLLAGYLLTGLSSVLAFFGFCLYRKNKIGAGIFAGLFLTVCYAIFSTGSRGAYLGLFGFMGVIFLYVLYFIKKFGGFSKIKSKYKILLGLIPIFCAGALCLSNSFLSRIISIFSFRGDSSISFRMNVYEACYQMFLDNKFLGIGVGNKNFREIYGLYMKTGYDALGSYCVPLEIAVESGIFALSLFMFFILLIAIRAVKYTLKNRVSPYGRILVASSLLTLTGTMFHGLFDTVFFRPQVQFLFWINVAIFHSVTIKRSKLRLSRLHN